MSTNLDRQIAEQTSITYSRWLKTDDDPPHVADPPTYNPDGTEGFWDLRGFSLISKVYRDEVRYVWAWQWVRE